jgi:DNA-binding MarR family transcriptional regulator
MGRAESVNQPRWLTSEERATWLAVASMLEVLPGALDGQLQRDAGLTFFEYMVLAMLSEQPDRTLRLSRLAAVTNGSLSRLSHVVSRLEREGYLRRTTSAHDRRAKDAVLTDAGWDKVVATAPGHVEHVRKLVIDPLSRAEQADLRAIGERIVRAVDPEGGRLPVGR